MAKGSVILTPLVFLVIVCCVPILLTLIAPYTLHIPTENLSVKHFAFLEDSLIDYKVPLFSGLNSNNQRAKGSPIVR